MLDFKKNEFESAEDFKKRVYLYKSNNPKISWGMIAPILNRELGKNSTPNAYRKELIKKFGVIHGGEPEDNLMSILSEIRQEKRAVQDLRNDANAQLRRIDREENIKQIALEYASIMKGRKEDFTFSPLITLDGPNKEGILVLSDWHYGLLIDSVHNKYDTNICKSRLWSVINQVIDFGLFHELRKISVFNLSDLISGRIHAQLRIQSQIDVVTQTMEVAEILRNVLIALSEYFEVDYYDCLDNHSRIEPNKHEAMQLESFTRVIHWYLAEMFSNNSRVMIYDNDMQDIISTEILGHFVLGVHGDKDSPSTIVQRMSSLTGNRPDLVLMAHRHHFSAEEQNTCVVLNNPSLMGPDQYSLDKRLTSLPSQLFIVVSEDNPVHTLYKVNAK